MVNVTKQNEQQQTKVHANVLNLLFCACAYVGLEVFMKQALTMYLKWNFTDKLFCVQICINILQKVL